MSDGQPPYEACALQAGPQIPTRAKVYLCASYALAAWAWRSWEFIVALVLIELYPNSLLMVSAYGLLDNLARVILGPVVGGYIDRHERQPGAHAMLRLQNLCIGGSAAAALVLLWPGSAAAKFEASYWALMWVLTLLGAASSAGSTGVSIAVEREAVKALCAAEDDPATNEGGGEGGGGRDGGNGGRSLARLNAVMRAIDLSALLCAPLAAGLLMSGAGPFTAAAAMAVYCGAAYLPEVALLRAAFRAAPVLGRPKARTAAGRDDDERTGLLAQREESSTNGGAAAGKPCSGADAAAAVARVSPSPAAASAATGSCFNGAAAAAASEGHAGGAAQRGHERKAPAPGGPLDKVADADEDLAGGRLDVNLMGQPLLGGPTDSMVSWPEGDGGCEGNGSLAAQPSSLRPQTSLEVAAASRGGGGGGGSAAAASAARLRAAGRAAARQAVAYGASWGLYWRQSVLLPCLALALLYMTVLSLGFLMTSFLKWSGLSEAEVSGYRGIGALTGLAATAIFPPLSARAGLRFCAVAGVTYQLACLAAGVLPVAASVAAAGASGGRPSITQVRVLVAGLVSSRTGLWLYDLAVTQLIQEEVRQDQLGSVYGVQSSLQASFEMLSFVAGLISPDPGRFIWLMLGSLGSVAAAATLVWCYVCGRSCIGRGRGRGSHVAVPSSPDGGGETAA